MTDKQPEGPLFFPMTKCEIAFDRGLQVVTLRPSFLAFGKEHGSRGLMLELQQAREFIATIQQALDLAQSQPRIVN
ncbi:hypothetical protein BLA18112_03326 [Burkholderia lata]|uniref:Uncharacterized protein n=1 Tax=Burkholderia lata (strain ATCC 17760 / DSM 23089 / LMG 22485 / NCIMB 9086 / R18194 / 383) TaxID=482957 RepID=A0A6P2VSD6_BURL3|nr:hypothetical protein [Burkholderia lata]VWC91100.1 hypothetical protein BLA18112_03326 [Burkholderia lata]